MGYVPEAVQDAERAGNYVDISLKGKKRIMKYIRPRSQPPSKLLDKRCEAGKVSMRQRSASGLPYSLLQMYLMRKRMADLANKTIETLQREERLGRNAVIVYARGYFEIFNLDEILDMTLSLKGKPKERLHKGLKKFRMEKIRAL